ncbi:MAG TPA: hypothetical protein PKD86_10155 [Gemmatales bacterium]|nr:hypothetical protein [Gemmatales bacterium]HMP59706.1 hypothetical protein [Gemmatales bacterium]
MRNLVFLAFLALVVFLITGWFMDWYSITGVGAADGKRQYQFEIDTSKIKQDLTKGRDKLNNTMDAVKQDAPTSPRPTAPLHF